MKIMVFLAEGFEEVEALTVVDYLRRLDLDLDMIALGQELKVRGAHGIEVMADKTFKDLEGDYDALVIPGGLPGATNLRDSSRLIELVKEMHGQKKLLAAICAGPIVFEEAGILKGREVTAYPGVELPSAKLLDKPVHREDNIITAQGPFYAVDFALALAQALVGQEARKKLEEDILYEA